MGLSDCSSIAVGKRADLVLLDWPNGPTPAVKETWVAGRAAFRGSAIGG